MLVLRRLFLFDRIYGKSIGIHIKKNHQNSVSRIPMTPERGYRVSNLYYQGIIRDSWGSMVYQKLLICIIMVSSEFPEISMGFLLACLRYQ